MLQFKAGDQRAFQHLFDKYKRRVIGYCYRYCGHSTVAEDLAQETFLRVYRAAQHYKPKARFSTWLFKIASNVCLNEIRKPIYRQRLESLQASPDQDRNLPDHAAMDANPIQPDHLFEAHERQAMVAQAITRLPKTQRAALLLRVNEEFSYREIGAQIGRSEGHVKTLIYRGRQQLRKALSAYFGENDE